MGKLKQLLGIYLLAVAFVCLLCSIVHGAGFQIMSQSDIRKHKMSLPKMPQEWRAVFDDPNALYYTNKEVPAAYQMGVNGAFATFFSPKFNISGDPTDRGLPHGYGGNANVDFPWAVFGGTRLAEGRVAGFKVMLLPKADNGVLWPMVYWTGPLPRSVLDHSDGYQWMFPTGTIFAEVLAMQDSRKRVHVFEIRFRIRRRDYIDVAVLVPFPRRADLEKVAEIGKPRLRGYTLQDNNPRHAFQVYAVVDELPSMPEAEAMRLLDTTPFKDATGIPWIKTTNGECWAPTTKGASIVPVDYEGSFDGRTVASCNRCHESTLVAARYFNPGRGWYGHVRGNGGKNFSMSPIDPRSISYNGGRISPRIRQSFVRAGLVAAYDKNKHPDSRYALLPRRNLQDAPNGSRMVFNTAGN